MITHRIGDATLPPERPALIAHVVNDVGMWGAGFSGALSARYPLAEASYRQWFQGAYNAQVAARKAMPFKLGNVLLIRPDPSNPTLFLAHLLAQRGVGTDKQRIDYEALAASLKALYDLIAARTDMAVHMPRIGCGLGGGRWWQVERLITYNLFLFPVFVYTLPATGGKA